MTLKLWGAEYTGPGRRDFLRDFLRVFLLACLVTVFSVLVRVLPWASIGSTVLDLYAQAEIRSFRLRRKHHVVLEKWAEGDLSSWRPKSPKGKIQLVPDGIKVTGLALYENAKSVVEGFLQFSVALGNGSGVGFAFCATDASHLLAEIKSEGDKLLLTLYRVTAGKKPDSFGRSRHLPRNGQDLHSVAVLFRNRSVAVVVNENRNLWDNVDLTAGQIGVTGKGDFRVYRTELDLG